MLTCPPLSGGGSISIEEHRVNERIRVPEVRLVGPEGEQIGIVSVGDALSMAREADLDLVEVAAAARPPVCKLMDYGKFKYESALKARESRKNQAQTVIKEMKLRPKIDQHDYDTKKGHVERFLRQGDKVKITIMFRGREQSRPEVGRRLLQRLAEDIAALGAVEAAPKQDGRNMIMVLGPLKRKTEAMAEAKAYRAAQQASKRAELLGLDEDGSTEQSIPVAPLVPAQQTVADAPAQPEPAALAEQVSATEPEQAPAAPSKAAAAKKPQAAVSQQDVAAAQGSDEPAAPTKPKTAASPRTTTKAKPSPSKPPTTEAD